MLSNNPSLRVTPQRLWLWRGFRTLVFPKARPVASLVLVVGSWQQCWATFGWKTRRTASPAPPGWGMGDGLMYHNWNQTQLASAQQSAKRQDEVRRVVVRSKTRRITLRNVLIYVNRVDPYNVHTSFVERAMKCLATADFCQRKDMIF